MVENQMGRTQHQKLTSVNRRWVSEKFVFIEVMRGWWNW